MLPFDGETHGPRIVGPGFHERVYEVVGRVPAGRVTTYGDVAGVLGSRRVARHVGNALAALPSDRGDVPWHRVVNSRGALSIRAGGRPSEGQRRRLEAEGVAVDPAGRVVGFAGRRFDFGPSGGPGRPRRHRRANRGPSLPI